MKRISLIALAAMLALPAAGQSVKLKDAELVSLINQMTLEEKARMCFGGERSGVVVFPGVPRLGIPDISGSDGPRGVTIPDVTEFPSGVGFAAAWNPDLAQEAGRVIGEEARSYGVRIVLGPAFNINRDPLGARFFEYMSEDPLLSGKIAAAQARGIQEEGVAACMKHFATNGRDNNRDWYLSWADERTLREIYLRGFEIVTKEASPWTAMTAANGLNGELCSDNGWLLNQVLKKEWGFEGIVMTDFCHSRSTVKAALAGLDMDMPWGDYGNVKFGKSLADAVQEGKVPMEVLDGMIYRHLWLRKQLGMLPGQKSERTCERNTPSHQEVSLRVAEEGLTLLKNDNGFLPLKAEKMKNIVVCGPNSNQRFTTLGLGGSSGAQPPFEITPLQGLKDKFEGTRTKVTYLPLTADHKTVDTWKELKLTYSSSGSSATGSEESDKLDFRWFDASPVPEIPLSSLQVQVEGILTAPETGTYSFRLSSDDVAWLWIKDMGAPAAINKEKGVPQSGYIQQYLEKGKEYHVRIRYNRSPEGVKSSTEMNYWARENSSLKLEWLIPSEASSSASAILSNRSAIKKADLVIYVGGLDHNVDCEGRDRGTMDYPAYQTAQIEQIAKLNSKTVVALIHGSPVTLPWLEKVPAVIDLFYPGMFGGKVLAEAVFGDINPSGHLTFSWPEKLEDSPAHALGHEDNDNVYLGEKLEVGYRYFDTRDIKPLFPFGYGLSYTEFEYSGMTVEGRTVKVNVKNTGSRAGKEVVQLYVAPENSPVFRPAHELKAFCKVDLMPGEEKTVTFNLDDMAFAYWDDFSGAWTVSHGKYRIEAGRSSRDIRLEQEIEL